MPPPCFWQKRLQAIENKESRGQKERQEKPRGCRLLKTRDGELPERSASVARGVREMDAPKKHRANADVYQNKVVAEKAIRKAMKTKG
jgi:hypothetical protein